MLQHQHKRTKKNQTIWCSGNLSKLTFLERNNLMFHSSLSTFSYVKKIKIKKIEYHKKNLFNK